MRTKEEIEARTRYQYFKNGVPLGPLRLSLADAERDAAEAGDHGEWMQWFLEDDDQLAVSAS